MATLAPGAIDRFRSSPRKRLTLSMTSMAQACDSRHSDDLYPSRIYLGCKDIDRNAQLA